MERWIAGAISAVSILALFSMLAGCTEPEPLYCDPEHPCLQLGYTCKYSLRTCVPDAQKDSGGDTQNGGADRAVSDAEQQDAGASDADPDTGPPDQGAGLDALIDQSSGGADAEGGHP